MTNDERKYIQKLFQLHYFIANDKDDEKADLIRDEMDYLEVNNEEMRTISCYCYALTKKEKDLELYKRYLEILFADTVDPEEYDNKKV